ncbi:MAG TPA: glycosyltransferase family 4 protein, partial [Trueperaceae bacterium]|nr:glycosyltransferase family 4 protein [Trueperaceae bacterium]
VSVVPFGIDSEVFAPRPGVPNKATTTIGTVKTLAPKYGVDTLLEAFALLKQGLERREQGAGESLRLRIVGGGPQLEDLRSLARGLGVADVTTFVGQVDHAKVPESLAEFDVYVALSRLDSESFGVAVLEASAMGLPVVVSDAGGLPEVVADGVTGLVVPRDDPAAAATVLERLVLDPERRTSMGAAGRAHVLDRYTWAACVDEMERVYRSVASAHVGGAEG